MSHYKPYPAYKDSGVEWLGRVPEHWDVKAIRWLSSVQRGASPRPIDDPKYFDDEGEYGWVRIEDVTAADGVLLNTKQRLSSLGANLSVKLQPGALFLSIAGSVGKPCVAGSKVCIHDGFVYFPMLRSHAEWLFKVFESRIPFIGLGKLGTQLNLNTETVGSIKVGLPPACEALQILSGLDCETARIDALIEKKTRFIELLREKRQALITHAVTKGLDPSAKMKDSGVEWLGEVPEHWGVKPLKLLVKEGSTISYGIVQPGEPLDEGVPFVQTTNMSSGDFEIESLQKTTPVIAAGFPRSRLTGGEVILGIRASIGAAFVVPMHLAGVNLSRGVARIDCSSELSSHFFVAYLSSMAVDGYWQLAKQGSTFNEVSIATVKELLVPVPPREEQAEIEGMLSNATARLNSILKKTERSIELLKERRSALITAAVTGQIDLREAV